MAVPSASTEPDFSFASDNAAGLCPEALAAFTSANTGFAPSYGDDLWTARARDLIQQIFATECDVFFAFNGTAANSLALAALCHSYHHIIAHSHAHIEADECNAPAFFTGGAKISLISNPSGKITAHEVQQAALRRTDVHHAKAGAVSLTQTTDWGLVYSAAELRAIGDCAKRHGLGFHLDGARLANAVAALAPQGMTPADLTWRAGVDVVCLGGTKNGMNATEAVVFFNRELARDFAYRHKQSGQLASKQRFASAQWVALLETGAWLRHASHANAMAARLAAALRRLPSLTFCFEPVANAVFVELAPSVVAALHQRNWQFYRFVGEHGYRFMCSWATTADSVDRFAADIAACVAAQSR